AGLGSVGIQPRPQLVCRLDGAPFGLGHDAQKIAAAYDLYESRDVFQAALVDAHEIGLHAIRTHHTSVQHAVDLHVLDVGELARHLAGNVFSGHGPADHGIGGRILEHGVGRDLHAEGLAAR